MREKADAETERGVLKIMRSASKQKNRSITICALSITLDADKNINLHFTGIDDLQFHAPFCLQSFTDKIKNILQADNDLTDLIQTPANGSNNLITYTLKLDTKQDDYVPKIHIEGNGAMFIEHYKYAHDQIYNAFESIYHGMSNYIYKSENLQSDDV